MSYRLTSRARCLCLVLFFFATLAGCGRVGRGIARGVAAKGARNVINHSSDSNSEDSTGSIQTWWDSCFAGGQDAEHSVCRIVSDRVSASTVLVELNQEIQNEPENADLYLQRADIRIELEQFEQSLADVDKAVELGAEPAEAVSMKHTVFACQGKTRKAFETLNAGIELYPESSDLYCERGYLHEVTNDYEAALADYRKATDLDPNNGLAWNNLASVLSLAPDAEYRDGQLAVEAASEAVRCCKDDNDMYCFALDTLGSALAEQGNFEQAIAVANRAIRTAPLTILDEIQSHVQLYQQKTPARYPRERSFQ